MGCVASSPRSTHAAVPITGPTLLPKERASLASEDGNFLDATQATAGDANPNNKSDLLTGPKEDAVFENNQSLVSPSTLLEMAMETTERASNTRGNTSDGSGSIPQLQQRNPARMVGELTEDEQVPHEMPDISYSIRKPLIYKGGASPEPPSPTASGSGGMPRNVVMNRPSIVNLHPGLVNGEFLDPHSGTMLMPMQTYGTPFMPQIQAPSLASIPVALQAGGPTGHPHTFHLAPLDIGVMMQPGGGVMLPAGRGRGRGMNMLGSTGPVLGGNPYAASMIPMGGLSVGRGQIPVAGRGRGQPPLHVVIPGPSSDVVVGGHVQCSTTNPIHAQRIVASKTLGDNSDGSDGDDDDNDDLIEDGEDVEDWGIDDATETKSLTGDNDVLHHETGIPGVSTQPQSVPSPSKHALQGREQITVPSSTLHLEGDGIETVQSDSTDGDVDDDDDNGAEGVHDWLDTDPDPQPAKKLQSSPLKHPNMKESHPVAQTVVSPAMSFVNIGGQQPRVAPSILPQHQVVSPHPPAMAGFQPPSLRQIQPGVPGSVSPTRPQGPPPAGSSPVKPPSYRSNIVTNGVPIVMPMASVVGSPVSDQSQGNAAIRDTKVVKKKKAELPQANLPHPVPKFGDWLNSRTMINNYIILESLGAGSYAEVKLCKEKVTGKLFAMKFINRDIMKKDKLGKQSKLDDIKREIAIMKKLNHPNVLRLYEVMDDPKMNKLFLVLEYMKHGDLLGHQKKKHPGSEYFNDRDLHCVLLQIILGLAYLHEQKIVHGDIKPQNLLVGDKDVVKIADFGISQSLYGSKQKLSDTAGTPAFMSPEMCSGQEYSGQLADIWAVGATAFMLKFGNPPFVAKSAMQMFERIQNDPLVFPEPTDPMLEDLLRGMLTKNPLKRMTLLQIMTHPWVTKEEHPSHFILRDKPPQITVTKEDIDNAIDATDKFAIIVNIRVQMMKRLQRARETIIKRRLASETHVDPTASVMSPISLSTSLDDVAVDHEPLSKSFSKSPTMKPKSSKVFVDNRTARVEANATVPNAENKHKMLSSEETQYRSQLFTRKKPSAKSYSGGSTAGFLHHAAELQAKDPIDNGVRMDLQVDCVDEDEDDVLSDDDDDGDAVSQSPQLLDELLLTTLSLPPLSKSTGMNSNKLENPHEYPEDKPSLDLSLAIHPSTPVASTELQDSQSFFGHNPHLQLEVAVSSLQGRRNTQEDRWTVLPVIPPSDSVRWAQSAFIGLYDGHGGDDCANILQDQFHAWLLRSPDEYFKSPEKLAKCFLEFDSFICDYLLHKGDLSGSTATCLFVDRRNSRMESSPGVWRLVIGHVGDCRLVLGRKDGETVELTRDHRLTVPEERDRILELGGRVVNNRVNGVMAITRAFGDLEFKGMIGRNRNSSSMSLIPDAVQPSPFQADDERTPPLLSARPDIHIVEVHQDRDEFLILACDGLWDVMSSEEATEILRDRVHLHGNLQIAAKELAQEGIRRYSNDNISVVVIQFQPTFPK